MKLRKTASTGASRQHFTESPTHQEKAIECRRVGGWVGGSANMEETVGKTVYLFFRRVSGAGTGRAERGREGGRRSKERRPWEESPSPKPATVSEEEEEDTMVVVVVCVCVCVCETVRSCLVEQSSPLYTPG